MGEPNNMVSTFALDNIANINAQGKLQTSVQRMYSQGISDPRIQRMVVESSEKDGEFKDSLRTIWRRRYQHFTSDVSVVGFKYIFEAKSARLRIMVWSLLIIVGKLNETIHMVDAHQTI